CCAGREGREEAVRGRALPALGYSGLDLSTRNDVSTRGGGRQRCDVTVDSDWQAAESPGNDGPILSCGCRHGIEHLPKNLHRTLDVVKPRLLGSGSSDLLLRAQLFGSCGDSDPVGFVGGGGRIEFGERAAPEGGYLGQSVGREVRDLVVVPGYAEIAR